MDLKAEFGAVLGRSSVKCLEKILLESLSPREEPLLAYRTYLANTVSCHTSHRSISLLGGGELDLFYAKEEPLTPPKYFNFFSGGDLSKLESCLAVRFVIVSNSSDKRLRCKNGEWQKIHDQRIYDLCRASSASRVVASFLLLEREVGEWILRKREATEAPPTELFYTPLKAEAIFCSPAQKHILLSSSNQCWIQVLVQVLGKSLSKEHEHSQDCGSLARFLSLQKDQLRNSTDDHELVVLVASHLRSLPRSRTRNMKLAKNNVFAVLKEVSDPGRECDKNVPVVSILAEPVGMYLLKEPFAQAVRSARQSCGTRDQSKPTIPSKRKREASSSPRPSKRSVADVSGRVRVETSLCPCEACSESKKYEKNMSFKGPQAVYRADLSLTDLLSMVGRLDSKAELDLERAGHFSVASFDIETYARKIDASAGNEDLNFEQRKFSNRALPRQIEATQEIALIGFQDYRMMLDSEPVQIFKHDNDRPKEVVQLFLRTVLDRRAEAVTLKTGILLELTTWIESYKKAHFLFYAEQGMMSSRFFAHAGCPQEDTFYSTDASDDLGEGDNLESSVEDNFFEKRRPTLDEEYLIIQEELLAKENKQTLSKADRIENELEIKSFRKIEYSWKYSLFGKIEARLKRLTQAYYVWALNGSSFDFVLLCSQLMVFAKENKIGPVSVQKEGSKLRWLKLAGVRFCEIQHLLFPGTSLASLAKTCNLKDAKGIFPFDKFTSMDYLDESKLPQLSKDWQSLLNPTKAPSQQEVDEALSLFEREGFVNVGEYLQHYLALDVSILLQCVIAMEKEYMRILGLDFIEVGKITVSSLSAAGAQAFLTRGKRMAQFSCNHARLYAVSLKSLRLLKESILSSLFMHSRAPSQLLKLSSRGGLTACTRSFAGEDVDIKPFADLMRIQMEEERDDQGGPGSLELFLQKRQMSVEDYLVRCNAHLEEVKHPQAASHAVYIDLGSLYATSGELSKSSRPPYTIPCDVALGLAIQTGALLCLMVACLYVLTFVVFFIE